MREQLLPLLPEPGGVARSWQAFAVAFNDGSAVGRPGQVVNGFPSLPERAVRQQFVEVNRDPVAVPHRFGREADSERWFPLNRALMTDFALASDPGPANFRPLCTGCPVTGHSRPVFGAADVVVAVSRAAMESGESGRLRGASSLARFSSC